MNKKLTTVVITTLVFLAIAGIQSTIGHQQSDPYSTDLIAAQHYDAGDVLVWNTGDFLYVNFTTADDWSLSETHLHVATSAGGIPQTKKGNPIPGRFDYKGEHDPLVPWFEYKIPNTWDVDDTLYIAAHAVVCKEMLVSGGLDELEESLPAQVTVEAVHAVDIPPYDQGYFRVNITGGTILDGQYPGWCIDLDTNMINYHPFTANVYSSYETLPASLLAHIAHPETFDEVNYILNQHFIGEPSPGCTGEYTFGDAQRTIWEFIETWQSSAYLGPWSSCRANEIYDDADDNGDGFIPGCDDVVAIILEPTPLYEGQICIIPVPIPCDYEYACETAWGNGTAFPGNNWGMYFTYTVQ
jgi:hypothetical protein